MTKPTPEEMISDIEDFFQLAMGHPVKQIALEEAEALKAKNGIKMDNSDTLNLLVTPEGKSPILMQMVTLETL